MASLTQSSTWLIFNHLSCDKTFWLFSVIWQPAVIFNLLIFDGFKNSSTLTVSWQWVEVKLFLKISLKCNTSSWKGKKTSSSCSPPRLAVTCATQLSPKLCPEKIGRLSICLNRFWCSNFSEWPKNAGKEKLNGTECV